MTAAAAPRVPELLWMGLYTNKEVVVVAAVEVAAVTRSDTMANQV